MSEPSEAETITSMAVIQREGCWIFQFDAFGERREFRMSSREAAHAAYQNMLKKAQEMGCELLDVTGAGNA